MSWWPGWNTVAGTTAWGHFWFGFGVVCLLLMGASEIVAYRYSLRKADLVAAAERPLAGRHDAGSARTHEPRAETGNGQAPPAMPHGGLSGTQKHALIAALRPFAGQAVAVAGAENDRLRQDLVDVFRAANWNFDSASSQAHGALTHGSGGVEVIMNQDEAQAGGPVLDAAHAVVHILLKLDLTSKNMLYVDPLVPIGEIKLVVGARS